MAKGDRDVEAGQRSTSRNIWTGAPKYRVAQLVTTRTISYTHTRVRLKAKPQKAANVQFNSIMCFL